MQKNIIEWKKKMDETKNLYIKYIYIYFIAKSQANTAVIILLGSVRINRNIRIHIHSLQFLYTVFNYSI